MEMIDVLKKLQEIAETKPELVKDAVESVQKTNPKEVNENAVESETPANKEPVKEYQDKIQEYQVGSFKDFLAAKGLNIYKLSQQDYSQYAQEYRTAKTQSADAEFAKRGTGDHKTYTPSTKDEPAKIEDETNEGGMSDIHIGAQEVVGEYVDDNGNLTARKAEVLGAMDKEKANAPFPKSYEIETAMQMVQNDFNDNGSRKHEIDEPEGIDGLGDSKQLNTNTMTTEDKKPVNESKQPVKEAITMTADSPEEAGMLMQIMKLAGVQQVTPDMMGAEEPAENPPHGEPGHVCGADDDEMGSGEMGRMRDVVTAPDEEKAEENFANSEKEVERDLPKTSDVDTLVNVHSGGANRQKQQVRKEYPGDNPLAVKEDTITEEELANSFRTQYEDFKKSYQEAAKPDYIDLDKDGNKKETMKKAAKDKEAK